MPVPTSTRRTVDVASADQRAPRWHSLDVLKGVALWAMIAHHFAKWTSGAVGDRFVGFDHFVITDLAAPIFAVSLGAAAVVGGSRIQTWGAFAAATLRWAKILVVGIVIDFVTHGAILGGGVLPTLAVLGLVVTSAVAIGVRHPAMWWATAGACAVLAVPATAMTGDGPLRLFLHGPFALPVYGVFAAGGAAVASHGLGRAERTLPLLRSAVGVVVVGLAAAAIGRGVAAPDGVWPPTRYPGHLAFTMWGLAASFLVWAAVRALLPPGRLVSEAVARAGRRTLLVFATHIVVKLALREAGVLGDLDTWRWGLVTWVAVAAVCATSTIPTRRHRSLPAEEPST